MKRLYALCLLGLMSSAFASDHANGQNSGGKLPDGFKFRKCAEGDEECTTARQSFMSQWKGYEMSENTKTYVLSNSQTVTVTSDVDVEVQVFGDAKDTHFVIRTVKKA